MMNDTLKIKMPLFTIFNREVPTLVEVTSVDRQRKHCACDARNKRFMACYKF